MVEPVNIVLASSSPYRKALLQRFGLEFSVAAANIDETPVSGETAEQLVTRLARLKAESAAINRGNALIIGSDQTARLDRQLLGKPGTYHRALAQLQAVKGRGVDFVTGICVLNTADHTCLTDTVSCRVDFRHFRLDEIERYLAREQPYDCAGSFKSEQLGITLVSRIQGDDPTALIGLPLIRLADMFRQMGLSLP